jgi:ParB family chromosome partitioning protein
MADVKGKKGPEPKRVLGRGLDALLPTATAAAAARVDSEFQRVPVERVRPQKGQPRKHFEETALAELAESIKHQGIIQPIVVRKSGAEFEIIAGERRWRAAQRAGLREVPIVVKDVAPATAFELALVENIQRTDLDAIETAEAYQRLIDEYDYTQDSVAARVGKNRATVANTLRLLQLPTEVRTHVVSGKLSEGHARAILSAREPAEMVRLAHEAIEKGWSVRDTERAARKNGAANPKPGAPEAKPKSANVRDLEKKLAGALGMQVIVREDSDGKSGVVEIQYETLDQLDRFIDKVLGG